MASNVGSWVKLHSLVGAPQHNGKYGLIKGYSDSGRYAVEVQAGTKSLGIKRANVELVALKTLSLLDIEDSVLASLPIDSIRTLGRLLCTHPRLRSLHDEAMRLACERLFSAGDRTCVQRAAVDSDHPLVGQLVQIDGLQSKPELNGCHASCVGFVEATGRYTVSVDGAQGFNVKPVNLTLCEQSWKTMLKILRGPRYWTLAAPGVNLDTISCQSRGHFNGPWPGRAHDTHVSIASADPTNPTTCSGYHPVTCGDVVMHSGRHYVEMDNPFGSFDACWMGGIMPADYDPTTLAASKKGAHAKGLGGLLVGMWHPATQGVWRDGLRMHDDPTPWTAETEARLGKSSPHGDLSACGGLQAMDNAQPNDEVLGLLLDLDEGSLAIYRQHAADGGSYTPEDDHYEQYGRLGFLAESGITGPVVWAAQMHQWGGPVSDMMGFGPHVRITPKEVPTMAEIEAEMAAKRAKAKYFKDNPPDDY